ncbi:hypothetical protein [Streptomyces sp. NPDC056701]|uniref:hypothetical protein n=1 Tax=Streptomyces sp. NPDC056701 TaxID=3345916 RepID=UPI0036ADDFB4
MQIKTRVAARLLARPGADGAEIAAALGGASPATASNYKKAGLYHHDRTYAVGSREHRVASPTVRNERGASLNAPLDHVGGNWPDERPPPAGHRPRPEPCPDNSGLSPASPRAGLAAQRIITAVPTAEPSVTGPVSDGRRRPLGTGHEHAADQPSGDAATGMMGP